MKNRKFFWLLYSDSKVPLLFEYWTLNNLVFRKIWVSGVIYSDSSCVCWTNISLILFNSTITNGIMINSKQNQVLKKFPVTQLFRPGKGCNIPLSSILQFETKTKSYYPSRNKPEVSLPWTSNSKWTLTQLIWQV